MALHGSAKAVVKNEKNITFAERNQFVLIFTFTEMRALTIYGVDIHVNHHYRSITRPAKATDVRIKRRIFNDCTGNGDFELVLTRQIYS